MNYLTALLPTLEHFRQLGYLLIFLAAFLESIAFVGIALPGTVLIVLAGFLITKGYFDIGDAIWAASIGAILGDSLSYYLGSHAKKFFKKDSKIFHSKYLQQGEVFFHKHGGKSIFIGRFVGVIRPIIPFVAGLFKMRRSQFLLWNILSGIAWATSFLFLGYLFGQAWQAALLWSSRLGIALLLFLFALLLFSLLKRLVVKKGKQVLQFIRSVSSSIKQSILANPDIKRFVSKHQWFFTFLKHRLDRSAFSGLPSTLLTLAFFYVLSLFAGVVEDVLTSDVLTAADVRIADLLSAFRNEFLNTIFLWITLLGRAQSILVFLLATLLILWIWKRREYIIPLMLVVTGSELFTFLAKFAFHRARPDVGLYAESSFSFPSGHATSAAAFYGFLTYIFVRNLKGWKMKVNTLFAGIFIIVSVGFSRLYLGVHFTSDVWGGYLVGFLWLIIGISLVEWLQSKKLSAPSPLLSAKRKWISLFLVTFCLTYYVVSALRYAPPILTVPIHQITVINNPLELFTNDQLKYTETVTGQKQEPISFIVIAENDERFIKGIETAGWHLADPVNIETTANLAKAALLKQPYPTAPMTPSFWDAIIHNFGFEKPTSAANARERHHARFWKTSFQTTNNKHIYVGTASLDNGVKYFITHSINPDIDTERQFLYDDLQTAGAIERSDLTGFVSPVLSKNFAGDPFFTDGKAFIVEFK